MSLKSLIPEMRDFDVMGFDVETNINGKYAYGILTDGNRTIDNKDEILKILSRPISKNNKPLIIVGMNIAYDLNSLFPEFRVNRIENKGNFITLNYLTQNKDFFSEAKDKKKKYSKYNFPIIIDLSNFIQQKNMKEIAEIFGETYIDVHDINHPDIKIACYSHARSCCNVFLKLMGEVKGFGIDIQVTAPATAMKIFRTAFLKPEHFIYKPKDLERLKAFNFMRKESLKAYHGAATEVFQKGEHEVTMIDVVSMYPFQMLKPIPNMNRFIRYNKEDLAGAKISFESGKLFINHEGMADIVLDIPDSLIIPPFFYNTFQGKNLSKTGIYEGFLTFPEIKYALELGCKLIKVKELYRFDRIEGFFTDYVNYFFDLKKKKDRKQFAKLMLNSLYGKFGQSFYEENSYNETDDDFEGLKTVDIEKYFMYEGISFKRKVGVSDELPGHSYPLIAAYITAYARIYLHQTMIRLGVHNIVYCDTDSIAFIGCIDDAIKKGVTIGTNLGDFELKWIGKMEARSPKYYCYKTEGVKNYVIKGVNKKHHVEFWDTEKCLQTKPRKIRTAIRTGKPVNEWVTTEYICGDIINKRYFYPDGTSRGYSDDDKHLQIIKRR